MMERMAEAPLSAGELIVLTGTRRIRRNVVVGGLFLAVVISDGVVGSWLPTYRTGTVLELGLAAAVVIGVPALWLVIGHAKRVVDWWLWRRRPVPAIRLTASGLDYSPAYTGHFPFHVDWAVPLRSVFRQGSDNTGFFWCLYSPVIDGLDNLPPFLHRHWPLDANQVGREYRQLIRGANLDPNSPEQLAAARHLVFFGTPIVFNPYYWSGPPMATVDAFLREHTNDRCTFYPPPEPVPPTIRRS